jgi:beta-lactamase superfamily II metal-dependent hydrolase
VVSFLNDNAAGRVDGVIATHLHIDHIGGLKTVAEKCAISNFYVNLPPDPQRALTKLVRQRLLENKKRGIAWGIIQESLVAMNDLLAVLKAKGITPTGITVGDVLNLGEIVLTVLSPNGTRLAAAWEELESEESEIAQMYREVAEALGHAEAPETTAQNNASVVLEIAYKGNPYALMTADAGADVLREVTAGRAYPFLKVPHHGSKTGLDEQLVRQIHPRTAYIPVGDNPHGHPANEVLDLLRDNGASTYCSRKTRNCRRECPAGGFGTLCHPVDRPLRAGWRFVDSSKCKNNPSNAPPRPPG